MKTRYREPYLSFLRLEKLKKKTTTRNNDRISSEQKKEIQDEARRVGLLLKEYDSLWTLQEDTSSKDTSSKRGTDDIDIFDVRPRQEPKTNQNQVQETSNRRRELRRNSLLSTTNATADISHMTPTMCAQSATPTNMWLRILQGPKKEGRHLTMRNRSAMTSRRGG